MFAHLDCCNLPNHGTAFGERAGLVEHDLPDQPEALKGLAGSHQDAVLRGLTGAADDGQRRGNADGTWIAHDQHAEAGENRTLNIGFAGAEP